MHFVRRGRHYTGASRCHSVGSASMGLDGVPKVAGAACKLVAELGDLWSNSEHGDLDIAAFAASLDSFGGVGLGLELWFQHCRSAYL